MSIIFGIAQLDNAPVENATLICRAERTRAYALDGTFIHGDGPVGMGFQPYHTTVRSSLEVQPYSGARGNILVFDGRLDNHEELAHLLSLAGERTTDTSLVLAGFERWGEACFERFVGDWSLALWSAVNRKLYLARDHAGMRSLYYQFRNGRVLWSTYLETFLESNETPALDEEFAARYLGGLPIRTSTPYAGIRAVPPGHVLIFGESTVRSRAHWSCMVGERLIYKEAQEYDDQFIEYFERAVHRRDIPGAPILAELSGGMDSTAIVCVSDALRRRGNPEASLLDTVSLYDNSEPDWNELPYITATEKYRGKSGFHVATSYLNRSFSLEEQATRFSLPGFDNNARQREEAYEGQVAAGGYRVILSGIGGDELLGGVPTPYPELADHLVALRFRSLLRRTTDWCLSNRDTFLQVTLRTGRFTLDLYRHPLSGTRVVAPWLSPRMREICVELARDEEKGLPRIGRLPSAISNAHNWLSILETMPHLYPKYGVRREYRYPYLDRDLVAYLLRIPREQLVQPGRRRAMMRRALKTLMPAEVVERRRKAFIGRGPQVLIQREQTNIGRLFASSRLQAREWVDMPAVTKALQAALSGAETPWTLALLRVIAFELWLHSYDGRLNPVDISNLSTKKYSLLRPEAKQIPTA